LDNPALEVVPIKKPALVDNLFNSLTSAASTKRLCDFMAVMSQTRSNTASQVNTGLDKLVLQPMSSNPGVPLSANTRLRQMLDVSGRIEHYLQSNPLGEEVVKFKLIIAYTMLYLTLEYGIVPAMLAADPSIGDQKLKRQKLPVFQAELASQQGVKVKLVSLKEKVRYGKVLWTMVTMGGILMLPMLAVAGPGISILAHDYGVSTNYITVLASRLAESNIWMAMCQALAPVAVELIFSRSCQLYTSTDMLELLVLEPLSAFPIETLYQQYLHHANLSPFNIPQPRLYRLPAKLTHKSASQMLSEFGLALATFPTKKYPNRTSHHVKLVEWLLLADENEVIELPIDRTTSTRSPVEIELAAFTSFLEPAQIADEVVHFLSRLWTQRGLPGWAMVSPLTTMKALEGSLGDDPKAAFSLAAGGRRLNVAFQHYVFPVASNDIVLPMIVSQPDRTVTLFVLVGSDATIESANQLLQVCLFSVNLCDYY